MPATLRTLVAERSFAIRPLAAVSDDAWDRPLSWVHSSDLWDPAPWLEPGNLLLTDGAQFTEDRSDADILAYCRRLRGADIAGIGFAVDVIHDRVPPALAEACAQTGLPLFEVGARTPFIGIIRFVADVIAAERVSRYAWLLDAQRAVAGAALRDDGLGEILRTLAIRLQTWVVLFDAKGSVVGSAGAVPDAGDGGAGEQARMLLGRGLPASLDTEGEARATLQTIGRSRRLRGVLAVGNPERLDPAEKDLIGTVIAIASIALEQQRRLQASRRRVRSAVVEMLVAGRVREAQRTARAVGATLPEPPCRIAVATSWDGAVLEELENTEDHTGALFVAERDDRVILLMAEEALPAVTAVAEKRGIGVGVARLESWAGVEDGIRMSSHAAHDASGVAFYDDIADRGLIGALRTRGGEMLSRTLLEPLATMDEAERERLIRSAQVWLDANAAWDPAARVLGIHRHTLRARMTQLGQVLGLDLETFAGRAELWAALELARRE